MDKYKVTVNGIAYEVEIEPLGASTSIQHSNTISQPTQNTLQTAAVSQSPQAVVTQQASHSTVSQIVNQNPSQETSKEDVLAPMQGKIVSVPVTEGQSVKQGQVLVILEAMKMENEMMAPFDCIIKKIFVATGQAVEANDPIVSLG